MIVRVLRALSVGTPVTDRSVQNLVKVIKSATYDKLTFDVPVVSAPAIAFENGLQHGTPVGALLVSY